MSTFVEKRIDESIRLVERLLRQAYLDSPVPDSARQNLNEARIELERIVDWIDRQPDPDNVPTPAQLL